MDGAGTGAGAHGVGGGQSTLPSEESTPTPKAPEHNYDAKFGVPYEITETDSMTDAPTLATYTVSKPTLSYGDEYDKPKHGQIVTFSVQLVARTGGVDYNAYDWYVRDASGAHYNTTVFGPEPTFNSGRACRREGLRQP
jgi:hypothetical protein